jgi:16S rRNA (cytosine967-C5)-methyltransferase
MSPRVDGAVPTLAASARALERIAGAGQSADVVLGGDPAATAAVRAITLGTLRWYDRLDAVLEVLLGPTRIVPPVRALLLVALHQLEYSRGPHEVIVSTSVDTVRVLGQPKASGLVNALLRRFLRERDGLMARALRDDASEFSHPRWLMQAMQQHWPDHWREIVQSNNAHPPMTLRVNLARGSREDYRQQLEARGLHAQAIAWTSTALMLEQPAPVTALPGFAEGWVSVQDAGAQLAATLLGAQPGDRVLDACAAPGGKTGAILEATAGLELVAIDVDDARLHRVTENLHRLQVSARCLQADLLRSPDWWDGRPFDRILVDAPCTATGVIRRHPDIKLLRRPSDVSGFNASQRGILKACLSMLKPSGRLLYSTCSLLPDENEKLVAGVLAEVPAARADDWPADVALPPQTQLRPIGRQLLPTGAALTDGFYYACLTVS